MPNEPVKTLTLDQRYLERVKRKLRVLKLLEQAKLGVFLHSDDTIRKHSIQHFTRSMVRTSERAHIKEITYEAAEKMVTEVLESMQSVLPYDVQYIYRSRQKFEH